MKTKTPRKPKEDPVFASGSPEGEAPVMSEPGAEAKPESKARLGIPLNQDGSIDMSVLRPATLERLRQAINRTPGVVSTPNSAEVVDQMFKPAMVSGLYDMVGMIESTLAQMVGKIPPDIATKIFTYSKEEKEALSEPTVRVLNKYVPDWMVKYQDEIALATTLGAITVAKFKMAFALAKIQQVQTRGGQASSPASAPVAEPDSKVVQ